LGGSCCAAARRLGVEDKSAAIALETVSIAARAGTIQRSIVGSESRVDPTTMYAADMVNDR
jgi:hypothetical protein